MSNALDFLMNITISNIKDLLETDWPVTLPELKPARDLYISMNHKRSCCRNKYQSPASYASVFCACFNRALRGGKQVELYKFLAAKYSTKGPIHVEIGSVNTDLKES